MNAFLFERVYSENLFLETVKFSVSLESLELGLQFYNAAVLKLNREGYKIYAKVRGKCCTHFYSGNYNIIHSKKFLASSISIWNIKVACSIVPPQSFS